MEGAKAVLNVSFANTTDVLIEISVRFHSSCTYKKF